MLEEDLKMNIEIDYDFVAHKVSKMINQSMTKERFESDEINELFMALTSFQSEVGSVEQTSTNPMFRSQYADINQIIHYCTPFLSKNGLCVIQRYHSKGDKLYLRSRLCHKSGQWIEGEMYLDIPSSEALTKFQVPTHASYEKKKMYLSNAQLAGGYTTYARRYGFLSILGLSQGIEDDGDSATYSEYERVKAPEPQREPIIDAKQLEELVAAFKGDKEKIQKTREHYGLTKLSDLPAKHFTKLMEGLRKKGK